MQGGYRDDLSQRDVCRVQIEDERSVIQNDDIGYRYRPNLAMAEIGREQPQRVPIYDSVTMEPMFEYVNTCNQPPRAPVNVAGTHLNDTIQHLISVDVNRTVRSSRVPKPYENNEPRRQSQHYPIENIRAQSGNEWTSAERAENTDHQIAKQRRDAYRSTCSAETGYLEHHSHTLPYSDASQQSQYKTEKPSADDVFNFMVKNMGGSGKPEDIKTQSGLFPTYVDINDWFRTHRSRFKIIERDKTISYVLVHNSQVTFCTYYNKTQSCSRSDCRRYHICKNMLSGKCVYENCQYSHDFCDENNIKLSNDLGYSSSFTNEEICSILKVSNPHLCTEWAERGKCGDESNCFGLHLCPRYLFGKCSNDQNCLYVHDRKSDHNKPIVEAFKMSKMQFDKFRWRVFMINNPEWKRDEPRTADGATSLPLGTKPTFNIKYPVKDEAVHMYNKKPVFQPRNTVNQGPRTPVKPTRPYTEEVMQCPPHMSFDIQPNAGESRVSRIDNGNPQPQSRSKHSSTQRTQRRSGNRCNSVERGVNASTRGRHQCIDHLSSGHVGNHQHNTKIPSADEVFNFMVKNMGGKGTPYDIKTRRRLFLTDFDINDWFRKNKSRFTLTERNGTLSYVLVFNKNVTYCFNYKCSKSDCRRYHVCKNMLSGKCEYGRHCKYSHDCFDENNSKISDKLGYSDLFTNEEIFSILKVSYPHVCTTWALKGSCRERYCFGLHICPRYIRDKCTNGPNCPQVHDRISDHNKPILDAFEMSDMQYDQFRLRLFMVWNGNEPKTADGTVPVQSDTQQAVRKKNLLKEETDEAGDTYICIRYLQDGCRERRCKFLHTKSKLPYLWQIKLSEKWISLNESEDIEKAFANKLEMSDRIHTTYNGVEYVILLLFEPNVRARVTAADDEATEKEARRLSTMSYKQLESSLSSDIKQEENKDSLCTQWRWYWKDDNEQLQLYRPDDLQHTLEVKYLAQQKKYIFSTVNYCFNYTISFDLLQQTNNDTGKRRAIRRRPLLVTSADVKENVYPESLTVAHFIERSLPKSWVPWDLAQSFELVDITDNKSSELDEVKKSFFETLDCGKEKIDIIFRLQNHKLWGLFLSQKKTMDANATRLANGKPVSVDQRYLFHGTDGIDAVRGICVNNFDIRVSGKSGTLYGDGAYFAKDSKYSHAYTKGPERYMFLVNVLVGHYTKGNKSYRRPPHKPGSDHELFDSCVNDITDPSIFVVFDKNQYYPEYLIKYHDEGQESVARKAKDKIRLHAAGIAKTIQRFTSDDDDKTSPAVTLQKADDQHDNLFKRLHTSDFRSNANILLPSRGLNSASSDCRWTDLSSVGTATTEQDRKYFETFLCNTISAGRDCTSQTVQSSMKTKDSRQKGIALTYSGSFDKEGSKKIDVTERLDFVDRNIQEARHPSVQTDIFGDRITISQHRTKESELFDAQLHHAYQPPEMKLDPEQYSTYKFAKSLRESDSSLSKMSNLKSPTRSKRYINQMDD